MTAPAPSAVMDAIVSTLKTKLGDAVVDVQTHDSDFGEDGALKDLITMADPGVLLCCLDLQVEPRDYDPPVANAMFVALCLARVENLPAQNSPGDVAMDLAGIVTGIVTGELWGGKATRRAQKVRARNENALKTRLKGVSVWSVTWTQQVELQTVVTPAVYQNLRRINFTEKLDGGANTPTTQANLTETTLHGAIP
jgi:hypothetical protein